jgi:hypothetical protein
VLDPSVKKIAGVRLARSGSSARRSGSIANRILVRDELIPSHRAVTGSIPVLPAIEINGLMLALPKPNLPSNHLQSEAIAVELVLPVGPTSETIEGAENGG